MIQKIINKKTNEVVYQGMINNDHGYWVRVYDDLSELSKHESEGFKYSEYYGGEYLLVEESEDDDSICHCCKQKLPKKDISEPHEPYEIGVVEIIEGRSSYDGEKTWMVCFR